MIRITQFVQHNVRVQKRFRNLISSINYRIGDRMYKQLVNVFNLLESLRFEIGGGTST